MPEHGFEGEFDGHGSPLVPALLAGGVIVHAGKIPSWRMKVDRGAAIVTVWRIPRGAGLDLTRAERISRPLSGSSGTAEHDANGDFFAGVESGDMVITALDSVEGGATKVEFRGGIE